GRILHATGLAFSWLGAGDGRGGTQAHDRRPEGVVRRALDRRDGAAGGHLYRITSLISPGDPGSPAGPGSLSLGGGVISREPPPPRPLSAPRCPTAWFCRSRGW